MNIRSIRVAISNPLNNCICCSDTEYTGGDYCPWCQYVYSGKVEVRDYADQTVSYFATQDEADVAMKDLQIGCWPRR